jgi:hypothetical protein
MRGKRGRIDAFLGELLGFRCIPGPAVNRYVVGSSPTGGAFISSSRNVTYVTCHRRRCGPTILEKRVNDAPRGCGGLHDVEFFFGQVRPPSIRSTRLTVAGGTTGSASLIVRNNSLFTTGTNSTFVGAAGTVELNSGAVLDARGPFTMNGTFNFLGGTFHVDNYTGDLDNQGGTLAPGHSAGNTSISGVYKQEGPATLQIEIGGTTPGTTFDTLHIGGSTVLAGTLNVSLISDFIPSAGNTFQIITAAGGIGGRFTSFVLPALSGLVWQLDYQPNSLSLIVTIPGDYNHNGTVDAADYVIWRKTLGQIGNWFAADGNGNGIVDNGDFDVWRAHFGQTAGSGSGAVANAAVPEPATLVLLIIAAAGWYHRRHRTA